ncbi:MAG: MFS transporter [Roseburia sp.]|nr:MFS transporter [Roseburia sp.]
MKTLSSKYYGENGIHRVPLWRIGCFALNNTSTNLYMFLMNYVAYYLAGWVGVGTVLAGSFSMIMRIWDGVTDPFVGFMVDKMDGKFGKNRPFMVIGNVILCVTSFILFHVTHLLPMAARFPFFIVVSCIYYLGYTAQCVVTKSAQTCLTNDPKQRPLFAIFDGIYNTILFAGLAVVAANLGVKYGGFTNDPAVFHELWMMFATISFVFMCIAVFAIAPKDRKEFFGTGQSQKIGLKDYWDTLKGNRAIQMLVVSAGTDKLAMQMKGNSAMMIVLCGFMVGDYALSGTITGMISIPTMVLMMFGVGGLATRLGQRKAMLIGSWGGIIINALLIALWLLGDYSTFSAGNGAVNWGFFSIAYIVLNVLLGGFTGISGNIVIPMTADCADYEVYRTGKYVPGLMGTLFSFVDKLISSFAPMLISVAFAAIGFTESLPDLKHIEAINANPEWKQTTFLVTLALLYGSVIIGNLCNVVALKFYPLTKEKMEEIQEKIAEIKAAANK